MEALPRTCRLVFLLLLQLLLVVAPWQGGVAARALNFTRADFPRDFVFGSGTSSYQVHHVHAYQSTTHAYGEALGVFPSQFSSELGFSYSVLIYMQYEGATDADGRSPSIWDTFTHAGILQTFSLSIYYHHLVQK
jgi:beta-glucosidase